MKVAELLGLPIGTRIWWEELQTEGEVVSRDDRQQMTIRWTDGDQSTVAPDDHDLSEFAGCLERAENADPDEPVVIERNRH